jgi:hypothetical protein
LVQAKGFTCEAFDAIACYGGTEGSGRNAQTQPGLGFMVGKHRQAKKRIGKFFAAPFHVTKFGRLVQTLARLKRQFTDRKAPFSRIALRAELLAALGTAASQQSTAALGGHARAEAVGTGTMQITGVEGTFHSSATRAKTTG